MPVVQVVLRSSLDTLPCSAGHTACYVSPYGDVYPCVQFPLPSGNLEIHARIENVYRGAMLVPTLSTKGELTSTLPATNSFDAYLQIRVIDLRAFLLYEDLTGQNVVTFTNRTVRGPRIFYGIKWVFYN